MPKGKGYGKKRGKGKSRRPMQRGKGAVRKNPRGRSKSPKLFYVGGTQL